MKKIKTISKIFLGLFLICSIFACGKGFQGSTIVGNPTVVQGKIFNTSTGEPFSGWTVYVPADLSSALKIEKETPKDRVAQASCIDHGTSLSCDLPQKPYCAVTCSCSDGFFSLDVSGCKLAETLVFCEPDGACKEFPIQCDLDEPICTVNIRFSN